MTSLMFLGAREMQVSAILRAKERGLQVVAVDPDPRCPGADLADVFIQRDLADVDFCIEAASKHAVQGVLTVAADFPVRTAAAICEANSLSGVSSRTAKIATDKWLMCEALLSAGVRYPHSIRVTSVDEGMHELENFPTQAIIKPDSSSGSRGVTLIRRGDTQAAKREAIASALSHSIYGVALVQEFILGREVSVESVTYRGETTVVAIVEKVLTEPPYFVEIGHVVPARLEEPDCCQIAAVVKNAIAAIGVENGITHVELRLSDRGPFVIEMGVRLGGGYITSHLVPLALGVSLTDAAIDLALGNEPDLTPRKNNGSAIRFLQSAAGKLISVSGAENARSIPGVKHVMVEVCEGHEIRFLRDARDRIGFVIAEGESPDDARRAAELGAAAIEFTVGR